MVDVLFDDIFRVEKLNPDDKKYFDKVTRIEARSERFDMFMHLDINSEVYPLKVGQKCALLLVPTLNLDGTPDTGYYIGVIISLSLYTRCLCFLINDCYDCQVNHEVLHFSFSRFYFQGNRHSLADNFEYVMHGKLYKITEDSTRENVEVLISFGGLLMMMKGDPSHCNKFELDQKLYLLMRKV
ncbi:hypothetical protein Ahy_A03g016618 isoform A [Arachis hypogaea]|uniref:Uncharacterized protein n=1 Tax=Arachis hypogaea TaxID=3818 RepID=A0A445E3U7_ARAHY|nr:hypothetical protein Ahy_A03g016618 isoform A [Arachis hypogaea]